ncbi:MAG: DNA-processing protein DprA, partial [Chloroflexota bacterium]
MSHANDPDLKYWLGFNCTKGIGPAKQRALLDHFDSIADAWHASERQLNEIGIGKKAVQQLLETRKTLDLDAALAQVHSAGITMLTWNSSEYPAYLKEIINPPPLLYVRGQVKRDDEWAVAVVGTRRLTAYGRQVTRELVRGLVRSKVTIVSGLARGIDSAAHKEAIDCGGRTLAVLGCGPDIVYPAENRAVAQKVVAGQGALISDYPLGTQPDARNFPPRNRIISGLSLGVIVVEAGRRSGALITAKFALEQDREVFAVPGNINSPASKGTNRLIQQGAKLVRRVDDILEELNLTMVPEHSALQMVMPESAEEAAILGHLSHQPLHIDELIRLAELPSGMVSSTLSMMELKGMVQQVGGMNFVLAREP